MATKIKPMQNPITGLVHVTGEYATGKTPFALTCGADLRRIAFFDNDVKGRETVNELRQQGGEFGFYRDMLKETSNLREVETHEKYLRAIDELKPNQYDVIVFDTWAPFSTTFRAYVRKHETKFREFYAPLGTIHGAEWAIEANHYEAEVLARLLDLAPLVIVVTHLKEHRIQINESVSRATGKQIPDVKKAVIEKSRFRIWLRRNPQGNLPIGLLLKPLTRAKLVDNRVDFETVLPLKINPGTWQQIWEYWQNPVGSRELTQDEKPNEFELSLIEGTLTRDQMETFRLALKIPDEPSLELRPDRSNEVRELATAGKSRVAIAKELKLTLSQVSKCLANGDH